MAEDVKSGSLREFLFVKRNLRNRKEAELRERVEAAGGNWQDYLDEQYYGAGYMERRAKMRNALHGLAVPFKATFAAGQFAWDALANIGNTASKLQTRIHEIFYGKSGEILPPRIKLPDTDYEEIAREAEALFEIDLLPGEFSRVDPAGTVRPAAAVITQQRALPAPTDVPMPLLGQNGEPTKDDIINGVLDCAEYGFNKGDLRLVLNAVRGNEEFAASLFYATIGRYAGRLADGEFALKGEAAGNRPVPAEAERLADFAAIIAGINEDVLHPSYVELLNDMDGAREIGIRPADMTYLLDTLEKTIGPRLFPQAVMEKWRNYSRLGSDWQTSHLAPPPADINLLVHGPHQGEEEPEGHTRPAQLRTDKPKPEGHNGAK